MAFAIRPRMPHHRVPATPWQQCARQYAQDPKLHPNPNVSPSTDPQSPKPSANPEGADSSATIDGRVGNPDPNVQGNIEPKGPNMEQAPHVSEEAAAMAKATGSEGPDVDQGTPVTEVSHQVIQADGGGIQLQRALQTRSAS